MSEFILAFAEAHDALTFVAMVIICIVACTIADVIRTIAESFAVAIRGYPPRPSKDDMDAFYRAINDIGESDE